MSDALDEIPDYDDDELDGFEDCPKCGGSGLEVEGWDCLWCDGTGYVEI